MDDGEYGYRNYTGSSWMEMAGEKETTKTKKVKS